MNSLSALLKGVLYYSIFIIFQLPLLSAEGGRQARIFSASSHPGEQHFISYTALYTDKVILNCPEEVKVSQPSWGRIVHGHEVGISQCYDNAFNCSINGGVIENDVHLLGNDDSGLYFCRVTGSHEADYYLNLTILAPPQLIGNIATCTSYNLCEQSHRQVDPDADNYFNVSVEYFGDNATVDWQHDGESINCTREYCTRTDVSNGLYHKSSLEIRVFHSGAHFQFSGNYTANVSSEYGWNVSSTLIRPMCDQNPPDETRNDTKTFKAGEADTRISCKVEYGDPLPYIAVCYAPNGESMTKLNVTENCLLCDFQQHDGYCVESSDGRSNSRLGPRPDWKVRLSVQRVDTCNNMHTTTLEIPEVSMDDNFGIVYCTWSFIPTKMHVYAKFNLKVLEASPTWIKVNWKKLMIGGVVFVGLVLSLVVLLLAALMYSWRKARRAEATRKRRLERRKPRQSNSPPLPMPTGQTGSDISDSEVVFKPQRVSRSSNSSQCSAQIVLDAEVHDQSPLLPKNGQPSTSPTYYGAVSKPGHCEAGDFTDAPLICTTADEGEWRLPGASTASKRDV